MQPYIIIIPCYNEEKRLEVNKFLAFSSLHPGVHFIFVNDGSTDNTLEILNQIKVLLSSAEVINLPKNKGKGESVRQGFIKAIQKSSNYIGYLDADLSTSLEEFHHLHDKALQYNLDMVLGSRIKKIDTVIQRSFFRHITGRIIATLIDKKYKLGVYDTQCGAKIFRSILVKKIMNNPFRTKWFFDVEILYRVKHLQLDCKSAEIPLRNWINKKNSKLSVLSFPAVLKDLVTLFNKY